MKHNPNKAIDNGGPTNGMRAYHAAGAVREACKLRGEHPAVDEDGIKDLFCDLMHLCDREELDAREICRWAHARWEEER